MRHPFAHRLLFGAAVAAAIFFQARLSEASRQHIVNASDHRVGNAALKHEARLSEASRQHIVNASDHRVGNAALKHEAVCWGWEAFDEAMVSECQKGLEEASTHEFHGRAVPAQIHSRNVVMVVPTVSVHEGGPWALRADAMLPRKVGLNGASADFSKVVLVGYSNHPQATPTWPPRGIRVGSDVSNCEGLVDEQAKLFFQQASRADLKAQAPQFLSCEAGEVCPEGPSAGMTQQLAILQALFGGSLKGNVLPVLLQEPDMELAVALGNALKLLIASGGGWEAERVLFVFAGDLSVGLDVSTATHCDNQVADMFQNRAISDLAHYFVDLMQGKAYKGCNKNSIPTGWSILMAAKMLAMNCQLNDRYFEVENSGTLDEDPDPSTFSLTVQGYGLFLFYKDDRPPGERASQQAAQLDMSLVGRGPPKRPPLGPPVAFLSPRPDGPRSGGASQSQQ